MKLLLSAVLLVLFSASACSFTAGNEIYDLRNNIILLKMDLFNKTIPPDSLVSTAGELTSSLNNNTLHSAYKLFREQFSAGASADTLYKLLNEFSFLFYNEYSEKFYNDFSASEKLRIILFSTTVSCECTLRQSAEFENAMYSIYRDNPSLIEIMLVDYLNDDTIQDGYNITFIPAMILIDQDNQELARFAAEDNIKEKLQNYFNERETK